MRVKERTRFSSWHEGAAHARWRGRKKVRQGKSKKTAGFLAQESRRAHEQWRLGSAACMLLARLLKHYGLIAGSALPHSKDDAYPHVCQGTNGHAMGLALCPLTLILVFGPAFLSRRLPGKLVENITQRLQAG